MIVWARRPYSEQCWPFFCFASAAFADHRTLSCNVETGYRVDVSSCDKPFGASGLCNGPFYTDVIFEHDFDRPPHVIVDFENVTAGQTPCAGGATDHVRCYPTAVTETGFRLICFGSPLDTSCSGLGGRASRATASWLAYDARPECSGASDHLISPKTCEGVNVGGLCTKPWSAVQTFSSDACAAIVGTPKAISAMEFASDQAGCVGNTMDHISNSVPAVTSTGIALLASSSPKSFCGPYEGLNSRVRVGYLVASDRPACRTEAVQDIETDTCIGAVANGLCTRPWRKTVVFPHKFSSPPAVAISAARIASNPPYALGATDKLLCRVVPETITKTDMVVECSGSPVGVGCGAAYEGLNTKATFNYIAIDPGCAVEQCRDGLDNDERN